MSSLRGTDHSVIGCVWIPYALLDQPIKELPTQRRIAPVESKGEFIKIALELLVGCAALKGTEKPSLEQRGDTMDSWQLNISGSGNTSMPIPKVFQPAIGPSAVANDQGAFSNVVLHEVNNSGTSVVREIGESYPADSFPSNFSSDYHDILCLPCGIPWRQPADQSLVYLDITGKLFASWSDHSSTQFVHHHPCRFIATKSEQPLESQRIDAHFLVGHPPHSPKPQPQGYLASVEYSSSAEVHVRITALAMEYSFLGTPRFAPLAQGTKESFWPANPLKVIPA